MDGLGGCAWYARPVFRGRVCLHPVHGSPSAFPPREGLGDVARVDLARLSRGSYLVDSASSHMLVSKIKPCMSKYKHFVL